MPDTREASAAILTTDTSLPITPTIRQIDALQLLRAIAVLLVVECHSGQVLDITGSYALPSLGIFGIDIFFVISGFILSLVVLKEQTPPGFQAMREFLKRRFIRIYPIYWVIALLTLARLARAHHLFEHNYVAAFFLLPSLHYPGGETIITYSWTMNFELFFYLLLGLILLKTIQWAIPVLIVSLVTLIAIGSITGIGHPVAILVANPILLEFVYGAVIALLYVRMGRRRVAGIMVTALGIVAMFCLPLLRLPFTVANGAQMIMVNNGALARAATLGPCAALIVGGVVFWSPSMKSTFGKWGVLLGNSSYSAYVVSALVLEFSFRIFFHLDPPPLLSFWNRLLFESTMVIAVMAAGLACYTFVEKPLLRWLQNQFLNKVPARISTQVETPNIAVGTADSIT